MLIHQFFFLSPTQLIIHCLSLWWIISIGIQICYYLFHCKKKNKVKKKESICFDPTNSLPFLPFAADCLAASSSFHVLCLKSTRSSFCPHPSAETALDRVISHFQVSKSNGQSYLSVSSASDLIDHWLLFNAVSLCGFQDAMLPVFLLPHWPLLPSFPEDSELESPKLSPWPRLFHVSPHSLRDLIHSHDLRIFYVLVTPKCRSAMGNSLPNSRLI